MQKILIIGSESSIGKILVHNLKRNFIVYKTDNIKNIKDKNYFKCDLTSVSNVNKIKVNNKFDFAIFCSFFNASSVAFRSAKENVFWKKNYLILKNSLNLSKLFKIKKIIYFSSAAVYGLNQNKIKISEKKKPKPINIYGKFKLYAENYLKNFCKKNNCSYLIYRLFHMYDDNGNALIQTILKAKRDKKKFNVGGDGTQSRDFVHVNELSFITKVLLLKDAKNKVLNICNSRPFSINLILRKFNVQANYFFSKIKEPHYLVGSNNLLKRLIGYKSKVNFISKIVKLAKY
jgi:nucleoside-diphosphate-sugar epimerase